MSKRANISAGLCAVCLALLGAAPSRAGAARVTTASPRIAIASPERKIYSTGAKPLVRFSCTSSVGIASCTATLGGTGKPVRKVASGIRVQLAKAGNYTLRVTARDRRGHRTIRTLQFAAERAVSWSGYTWFVRRPGWGGPGLNHWSDTSANLRVSGGDLLLSSVKDKAGRWTSVEVDNQRHLGYGTYRWVVSSDLSDLDPNQVLGMFTFAPAGALADEIDMEVSRWGNPLSTSGSAAVWQTSSTRASEFTTFNYSDRPPYIHQFTWSPGEIRFLITDATGTVLLDWTVVDTVPTPSSEVPSINYWRFHNVAPTGASTVRIAHFTWSPLGNR